MKLRTNKTAPRNRQQAARAVEGIEMDATLTGDELAIAQAGVQHALAWWKSQPASDFKNKEIKKFDALNVKLSAIADFAYPYNFADEIDEEIGSEPLMKLDQTVVVKTRQAAKRAVNAEER